MDHKIIDQNRDFNNNGLRIDIKTNAKYLHEISMRPKECNHTRIIQGIHDSKSIKIYLPERE